MAREIARTLETLDSISQSLSFSLSLIFPETVAGVEQETIDWSHPNFHGVVEEMRPTL
jgi:hypothetical protein